MKDFINPMYKMPRRFAPRRRLFRRKRMMRRPIRRFGLRRIAQPVQYFKRSVYFNGLIAATTTDVTGAQTFSLNQVPNSAEFTSLYDQYQIRKVKISLIPRANVSENGANSNNMGVFTVLDYDDNTPLGISALVQYQNMKMTRTNQKHTRYFTPCVRDEISQSVGGTTAFRQLRNPWIDCNNDNVAHFGLKYAIQALPAGTQTFDVMVDYYLAFKNVR